MRSRALSARAARKRAGRVLARLEGGVESGIACRGGRGLNGGPTRLQGGMGCGLACCDLLGGGNGARGGRCRRLGRHLGGLRDRRLNRSGLPRHRRLRPCHSTQAVPDQAGARAQTLHRPDGQIENAGQPGRIDTAFRRGRGDVAPLGIVEGGFLQTGARPALHQITLRAGLVERGHARIGSPCVAQDVTPVRQGHSRLPGAAEAHLIAGHTSASVIARRRSIPQSMTSCQSACRKVA